MESIAKTIAATVAIARIAHASRSRALGVTFDGAARPGQESSAAQLSDAISEVSVKVSQLARNIAGEFRVAAHCHAGYH
jgi:hypothetical protein